MQAILETTNDSISAGPVLSCAATPVSTKMPVPMIAPTPRLVSDTGPSTRRSRCSPAISSSRSFRGLVAKSGLPLSLAMQGLLEGPDSLLHLGSGGAASCAAQAPRAHLQSPAATKAPQKKG